LITAERVLAKVTVTVVLLLVGASCTNGGREYSDPKIIGGQLAGQYPFMVGLVKESFGDRVACGAALIKKNVVVTAAHCVEGANKGSRVVLGSNLANVPTEKTVTVRAIISHPKYKGTQSTELFNDIAVLILDEYDAAAFDNPVAPIELNRDSTLPESNGTVKVIGWGNTTSHGNLMKDELREVTVPTVSIEKCKASNQDVNDTQICSGDLDQGGIDSCQGDSGGPLVTTKDGKTYLAGVVSYGDGCAQKGKPGVYTRVSAFAEWIETTAAYYTETQSDFSGKRLSDYVKSYCIAGFRSEKAEIVEQSSLNAIRTYGPSDSFVPANLFGEVTPGTTLDHCDFTIPAETGAQKVSVDAIETEQGVRFEATVGEKKFIAGAIGSFGLGLNCSGDRNFTLNYDSTGMMSYARVGDAIYMIFDESGGGLDGFSNEAECAVKSSSARILSKATEGSETAMRVLVVRSPFVAGGLKVFNLYNLYESGEERAGVTMRLVSSDDKKGSVVMVNDSGTDIFTWRLSCNRELVLTDPNGVVFRPLKEESEFVHEFVKPSHALGTFLSGQRAEFKFDAPESVGSDLSCKVNGMTVDLTTEIAAAKQY
jgi:trypsin